jgi:hypothetical protein
MAYSDSIHFFDKLPYKILFISNYRLKDMILASFKHLQQFLEKQLKGRTFLTQEEVTREADSGTKALTRR